MHDPSILRTCEGTYIVYGTKSWVNEVACPGGGTAPALISYDRYTFSNGGYAFPNGIPTLGAFDGCDSVVWAPDTQLVNGTYYMYYSGAKFGDKCSMIGVATSATGYPGTWVDLGAVFDSCSAGYNAIDPNLLPDTDGRWYLTFGSFFAGIYSVELDPATAKLKPGAPFIKVASRNLLIGNAVEGPFVFKKGALSFDTISNIFRPFLLPIRGMGLLLQRSQQQLPDHVWSSHRATRTLLRSSWRGYGPSWWH